MRIRIRQLLSFIIKLVSRDIVVNKQISGFNKRLFYEKSQHLTFYLSTKISYEVNIWNNIQPYLKEGHLIFDIGGNIGQYALRFSEIAGDNGKVVSFEPDFKNFSFLQFNININDCKNTICRKNGLGSKSEVLEFYRDTETGGRMGSFRKEDVGNRYKGFNSFVSIETFHKMVEEYGIPDFVKIDVEGFESEVIRGINDSDGESVFLIEVREDTKEFIFTHFDGKKYKCMMVDGKDPVLITNKNQIPSFANLLFTKTQN